MRKEGGRYGRRRTGNTLKYCVVCNAMYRCAQILFNELPTYLEHLKISDWRPNSIPLSYSLNKRKRWKLRDAVESNQTALKRRRERIPFVNYTKYPHRTEATFAANKRKLRPLFLYNPVPHCIQLSSTQLQELLQPYDEQLVFSENQLVNEPIETHDWLIYSYEDDCTVVKHTLYDCIDHALGDSLFTEFGSEASMDPVGWRPMLLRGSGKLKQNNCVFIHNPNHKKKGKWFACHNGATGLRYDKHINRVYRKGKGVYNMDTKEKRTIRKPARCHQRRRIIDEELDITLV